MVKKKVVAVRVRATKIQAAKAAAVTKRAVKLTVTTFCLTCGLKDCPKISWCDRVDLED